MKDFFISYNGKDKTWVEWIAYQLEETGYTTIIQTWDFRPGGNFVLEMHQAAAGTERTLAVLSQNYLDAEYTHPEWAAAFAKDPQGKDRTLVPVRITPCELPGLLAPIIYVDLVGEDEQAALAALLDGVKTGRAKPQRSPVFPGQQAPTQTSPRPKPEFPGPTAEKPWNVPHVRNPFFTGREEVLKKLHETLTSGSAAALSQP
ncbi:MAG: TIR domain-containing protein [Candidatus Binatia bacterium]